MITFTGVELRPVNRVFGCGWDKQIYLYKEVRHIAKYTVYFPGKKEEESVR